MVNLDTPEKILDRIAKLLAHAKGTTIAAEAESFTAKAKSLMQQWGVEAADLEGRDETVYARVNVQHPYTDAKVTLLRVVAVRNRCGVVFDDKDTGVGTPYRCRKCIVWGTKRDTSLVELLYDSLSVQCMTEMTRTPIPTTEHGKTFRNNFIYGYASRVYQRLRDIDPPEFESTELIYTGFTDENGLYLHSTAAAHSALGRDAGGAAADRANLQVHSLVR